MFSNVGITDDDYFRLRELVTGKSGLEFPTTRRIQLEGAITQAVDDLGLRDARELWHRLRKDEGEPELEKFIESVSIGETYFFRNEPHFRALKDHVLPELLSRRKTTKTLRVWSAGCSSGEEPYSVAMVLDGLLHDEGWDVTIMATDINRSALQRARDGIYRPWSLRRTPHEIRDRYFFERDDGTWELNPRIRGMVNFDYLNLVEDRYPSLLTSIHTMDVILCRNVLIYFNEAAVAAVAEKLYASLADDGFLLAGHADPVYMAFSNFAVRTFPDAVLFERKPAEKQPAAASPRRIARARSQPPAPRRNRVNVPPVTLGRSGVQGDELLEASLRDSIAGSVEELVASASQHPDDPRPPYLLAKLLADRLDVAGATKWIAETLRRDELFAPAHYVAGLMAEEDGRLDDAIAALRRSLYADQGWALPHFVLGRCFAKAGEKGRASVALSNAIRLLENRDPAELVAEGDGLTVGRLLELATIQAELSSIGLPEGASRAS